MPPQSESDRLIEQLSQELKKLETEYSKFFAGRSPRPPADLRSRVDAQFRQLDRRAPDSARARFRFQTLQARYTTFTELWDRTLRAREEGRPLPGRRGDAGAEPKATTRGSDEAYSAVLQDAAAEGDRVRNLYDALMAARRRTGLEIVPFGEFAKLVSDQVERLRRKGATEVMFRVTVSGGRPNLTAKAVRRRPGKDE